MRSDTWGCAILVLSPTPQPPPGPFAVVGSSSPFNSLEGSDITVPGITAAQLTFKMFNCVGDHSYPPSPPPPPLPDRFSAVSRVQATGVVFLSRSPGNGTTGPGIEL